MFGLTGFLLTPLIRLLQKQPEEVFHKKAILKNCATFIGKHLCWSLSLTKLQPFSPATLLKRELYSKETPTQVISCEYCEIFKNTYFEENLGTAASSFSSVSIGVWNTFEHILTVSRRILLNLRVNLYNLSQITEYFLTTTSVSSFRCLSYLSKKVEPAVDMYNFKAYLVQKNTFY